MLNEYDCVRLRLPLDDVPVGAIGVILMAYTSPRVGYEVEFFDESKNSLGTFTTDEEHLEKIVIE
jgi:hypothetical protein